MNWLRTNRIGGAKTRQRNVKENGEVVLKELIECCDGKCNPIKSFPSDQIIKATDNFSQSNRASRIDVYYRCYKGILDDRPVLIKKGKYTLDIKEICGDIAISSMVSGHKNFLKLLGCCLEFTPPVLVFEYAEIITLGPLVAPNPRNMRRIKIASRDVSYVAASPMKEFFRLALRCIGCNLGDPLSSMIQVTKELKAIEKSAYGHHR